MLVRLFYPFVGIACSGLKPYLCTAKIKLTISKQRVVLRHVSPVENDFHLIKYYT